MTQKQIDEKVKKHIKGWVDTIDELKKAIKRDARGVVKEVLESNPPYCKKCGHEILPVGIDYVEQTIDNFVRTLIDRNLR